MSDFHPLQARMACDSTFEENVEIYRGTTFKRGLFIEHSIPSITEIPYEEIVDNFQSVGKVISAAYADKQVIFTIMPLFLEFDRIEFTVTSVSGKIVLRKYFSTLGKEISTLSKTEISLTADETALLEAGEYEYTIVLEHLYNRVGEYLNTVTFGYRHLAIYGMLYILDAHSST